MKLKGILLIAAIVILFTGIVILTGCESTGDDESGCGSSCCGDMCGNKKEAEAPLESAKPTTVTTTCSPACSSGSTCKDGNCVPTGTA